MTTTVLTPGDKAAIDKTIAALTARVTALEAALTAGGGAVVSTPTIIDGGNPGTWPSPTG